MNKRLRVDDLEVETLATYRTANFIFSNHNIGSYTRTDKMSDMDFYEAIIDATYALSRIDRIQWSAIYVYLT